MGAGCTKLKARDLAIDENLQIKIAPYYDHAEAQVGIYYHGSDLLDEYLGKFKESQNKLNTPEVITFPHSQTDWAKIGRTRQAFLQSPVDGRKPCNNCGGCFIYCKNKTIYNAQYLFQPLPWELYESCRVTNLLKVDKKYVLELIDRSGNSFCIAAKFVILAAGTMGSTRLVSSLVKHPLETSFHHNMVERCIFFGFKKEGKNNFPMGQYIVKVKINEQENAYASLTHGISIPTSDILDLLPFKSGLAYKAVNYLKKYLVVAMIFYSSDYSNYKIKVTSGKIQFSHLNLSPIFKNMRHLVWSRLRGIMRLNRLYSFSFLSSILPQGSDIHYGGTLPIGLKDFVNCSEECEIRGFPNLYVIDGSWMPRIPEKSHTFTIIANALRVADCLANKCESKK